MADFVNIPLLMARLSALIVLSIPLPGIAALCIEEVQVPARVQTGETVTLSCYYDLEGKTLYSLNWWRGSEQFYQYSPKGSDKKTVYDAPGITVDMSRSGKNLVVLRNVSRATAGKFKCEVLAEYPSFEKDSEITEMEVIDVPDHPPIVALGRVQWSPGEVLAANCSYPGARPEPHLQWYINNDQIPPEHSRMITPKSIEHMPNLPPLLMISERGGDAFRVSELTLVLKSDHFSSAGRATLKCVAYLPELYRRSEEVTFTMPGFRAAAPSQKFYGSGHPPKAGSMALVALLGTLISMTL